MCMVGSSSQCLAWMFGSCCMLYMLSRAGVLAYPVRVEGGGLIGLPAAGAAEGGLPVHGAHEGVRLQLPHPGRTALQLLHPLLQPAHHAAISALPMHQSECQCLFTSRLQLHWTACRKCTDDRWQHAQAPAHESWTDDGVLPVNSMHVTMACMVHNRTSLH